MKNFSIALVVVAVLGGGYLILQKNQTTPSNVDDQTTTGEQLVQPTGSETSSNTESTGGSSSAGSYTMAQVATHKDAASCWSVIDANVYDLTKWIPQHPGGEQAILGLCGKDGTAKFHGQHDDAKRQADILATMKIGVFVP